MACKQKPILNPILEDLLGPFDVEVPTVDCQRCTRSLEAKARTVKTRWRDFKCCTFQPFVANFYCGAMLEQGLDPLKIESGKAVLQPLGVLATREYRDFYYSVENDLRSEDHLCSYYDRKERRCKVWEYRPAECGLYYCGDGIGREAREDKSKQLFQLESSIAQMALAYYGMTRAELNYQIECLNAPERRLTGLRPEEAREIYVFAWDWFKSQKKADVLAWID